MAIYSYRCRGHEVYTQTKALALEQAQILSENSSDPIEVREHVSKIGTPTERIVLALNGELLTSSTLILVFQGGRKLEVEPCAQADKRRT